MTRIRLALGVVLCVAGTIVAPSALAGGGPENVVVVVNPNSWASLTVANEYVRLRQIPPCNVIALDLPLGKPDDAMDVDDFREKVLQPILAAIEHRGLDGHVDCVAYSADIPTSINFTKDLPGGKADQSVGGIGSINGLTFFYQLVLDKGRYWSLTANPYYRAAVQTVPTNASSKPAYELEPTLGFSRWCAGRASAATTAPASKLPPYLLSIVLGVTSVRGNSVDEATGCLRRACQADGTAPKGTFFFVVNENIRSTTRQWGFAPAIARLKAMGLEAETTRQPFPKDRDDVMGAMLGLIFPKPEASGSKVLPGAIVENLTSEGGMMSWAGGQTPISDFIRCGAAGTSGTVTEPLATQAKFPTPFIFCHYGAGCSLVEAFYQSVSGPYQLLIIGEPLCRPYAKIPTVTIGGVKPNEVIYPQGAKAILARPAVKDDKTGRKFSTACYVDGKPVQEFALGSLTDGCHELMAVATADDDLATQGWAVVPIEIRNKIAGTKFSRAGDKPLTFGDTFKVGAEVPGAKKIEISHLGRVIKTIEGEEGAAEIDSKSLGFGPARLDAAGIVGEQRIAAMPLTVQVDPARQLPAVEVKLAEGEAFLDGPILTADGIGPMVVEDMRRKAALQEAKVPAGASYKIEAYFDVAADDLCQFQVWTDGRVTVSVDGTALPAVTAKGWTFLPVALAKGRHKMTAEGVAGEGRELDIRYGPPGARSIGKRTRDWDADHVSLHFAHVGPRPPTTTTQATQP